MVGSPLWKVLTVHMDFFLFLFKVIEQVFFCNMYVMPLLFVPLLSHSFISAEALRGISEVRESRRKMPGVLAHVRTRPWSLSPPSLCLAASCASFKL